MIDSSGPMRVWGAGRMAPFAPADPLPYVRVELDPVSQTARRFAADGTVVELGKHGTSKEAKHPTQTSGKDGGDPKNPPPPDTDEVTAYVPD